MPIVYLSRDVAVAEDVAQATTPLQDNARLNVVFTHLKRAAQTNVRPAMRFGMGFERGVGIDGNWIGHQLHQR